MKLPLLLAFLFSFMPLAPARADTNTVDAKAEAVLRSLSAFFKDASSFKVDMEAATRIEAEDMKQEFTTRASLMVKKPAKLVMTVRNSMIGSMILVCDGTTLTTFLPAHKRYTVKPAPASLELLSHEMGASSPACLPVISALLESDPYSALIQNAECIRYVGEEKRDGIACHHLKFTHRDFDCDAWIRSGPKPLIEAIKPCLSKMNEMDKMPEGLKTDVILQLSGWEINTDFPDSLFTLELPPDAQKSDALLPGMGDTARDEREAEPPGPADLMRSKPAPLFKLPLLSGGEFDLAAQKDKSATLLCFWTTWAGPCRNTLPILEKLAADYKDKAVSVVSINQQESTESILAFMKHEGVRVPVALDKESEVAGLYQVAGVPQIVIIDKSGVVRDVYMGYGKTLEDDLRVILNTLAASTPAVK